MLAKSHHKNKLSLSLSLFSQKKKQRNANIFQTNRTSNYAGMHTLNMNIHFNANGFFRLADIIPREMCDEVLDE